MNERLNDWGATRDGFDWHSVRMVFTYGMPIQPVPSCLPSLVVSSCSLGGKRR